jgi:hypothetical protein
MDGFMGKRESVMKVPEFLVFARALFFGFLGAEVGRVFFYLGSGYSQASLDMALWIKLVGILSVLVICLVYAYMRKAHLAALQMARSLRIDLFAALCVGVWVNQLVAPLLSKVHLIFIQADPYWAPAALSLFCVVLLSPLFQLRSEEVSPQLRFLADEEIDDGEADLLAVKSQAKAFAEAVLDSSAQSGLVFGVDGPWGVGKTSFINLAERYWSEAAENLIVCRFEPLRYASEPDLAACIIRDLSAEISKNVFAPEFRPAASRYSRLIKGKADVSFLGFKISLEPTQATVDELLDDVDEVLRRIGKRVIVVVDDLDRLDAKTTNNVLFATRRTFRLSRATYILCYDTEVLASGREEGTRAREFLEKFVTAKISLFVDMSSIRDFLRRDWRKAESNFGAIPSDTMVKLGAVLSELADMLDGSLAAQYIPLVGDLRKVKRFVNALLLMQIEKSDLGRSDFNKRDLINLALIHLNYPGLFRRIYSEETEGRVGSFSLRQKSGDRGFENAENFSSFLTEYAGAPAFLLEQLFSAAVISGGSQSDHSEEVFRSRARFNHADVRNLEKYLKLIVRFVSPEPRETFALYARAVDDVRKGASISSVLSSEDFDIRSGEEAHDQFWRVFVNVSSGISGVVADDAIKTLVSCLPRYSSLERNDRGLRQRSIYSLVRLLNSAGWGGDQRPRVNNMPENVVEIAWRIYGEGRYGGQGLLLDLVADGRGVIGWNDLMLFRLFCCEDRQGQLFNLYSALIYHQDESAQRTGFSNDLALMGMRGLSQRIFSIFKAEYILPRRNFFRDVDAQAEASFFGEALAHKFLAGGAALGGDDVAQQVAGARSAIKSFVIYQLANKIRPNGSGVGCGLYDEAGHVDGCGIARLMSEYVFGYCFNPDICPDNALLFLDHCLSHLSNAFFLGRDDAGYLSTKEELPGGLDSKEMGRYWLRHMDVIRQQAELVGNRQVFTQNYVASYHEDLNGVYSVLDELAKDVATE